MVMNFEDWKSAASIYANKVLSLDPFEDDDPYDLFEAAQAAFESEQTPEAFIREMFEEDLAAQAYNDYLVKESLKSNG